MAVELYPLKFKPIFKRRIWGGGRLREIFDKDIPAFEEIGESWELADLPDDKSVVANGRLAGQTLASVIQKYPKELTGDANFPGPFPLLIKFLDVNDILSIQVHPDPAACRRMGKGRPKTECWYIISAADGSFIYKGLKKGVSRDDFAEAVNKGKVENMLTKVPVRPGQCHFLPAGTVHSAGPGLLIAEIQTPSDTTYRVFDFNRLDDSAKPRPLHIKEALQSIHFDPSDDNLSVTTAGRLVDCEYFKIDKSHQTENSELLLAPGKMKTLIVLTGCGIVSPQKDISVEFKAGDCLLIPAAYEGKMQFAVDTQYLNVTV